MALYKRGLTWWMRFTYSGEQVRKSTGVTDRKLAEKIYNKILYQIAEGKWLDRHEGEGKNLRDLLERYIDEYSIPNKSHGTVKNDRAMVNEMLEFFGDMPLTDFTPPRFVEYKNFCREKGLKAATINHRRKLLCSAFTLALREWDWVSENPLLKVKAEKVRNERDRWLTSEEEAVLLEKAVLNPTLKGNKTEPRYWLQEIMTFALQTGMRQDEILSLKWRDVDLARETVTVMKSKNGDRRTIPLSSKALALLSAKSVCKKSDYVFANEFGRKFHRRNLMRAFEKVIERAGIVDFTFHDLRHAFATRLAQAGVDLYTISKLLGHRDTRVSQRYAHHSTASLRNGVSVLNEISTNLAHQNEKGATLIA